MTERERLIKLLDERIAIQECSLSPDKPLTTDSLADYLLAHGVIVPPCKVGDTVWLLKNPIERWKVECVEKILNDVRIGIKFAPRGSTVYVRARYIGDLLFLTREEAEAALEERRKA